MDNKRQYVWNDVSRFKSNRFRNSWKWIFQEIPPLSRTKFYSGCGVVRFFKYLVDYTHWNTSYFPSFAIFFIDFWNKIFSAATPWFSARRIFLTAAENLNGSKLIDGGDSWTYIRNRHDFSHYRIKFFWFYFTVEKEQFINIEEDTIDSVVDSKTIYRGWVFSKKDVLNNLNKISLLTSDLDWF